VAQIRPFSGIRYSSKLARDFASLIAPPYDVLDESDKARLQAKHPNNIVNIDLPHMPPKTAGPDSAYQRANELLQAWMTMGVLTRDPRPALYPYAQTYQHGGRSIHRRGFIALVRLSPFGAGEVVPHEKTHQGAIEDRYKLMTATGLQLSPIFGLFSDPRNEVNTLLYRDLARPELSGSLDGIQNDLWHINDGTIINAVTDLMKDKPIYIADGHHRYTTALQYQQAAIKANGGPLPPNHPANFCMFVLVGMQDPGLLILPTHRMLGGLGAFDIAQFKSALGSNAIVEEASSPAGNTAKLADLVARSPAHTFGLYEGKTKKGYLLKLTNPSVLARLEPGQSQTWRELDVAILQRYLIDEVIKPTFCGGIDPARAYTADASTIAGSVDGSKYQVALLLQATPLHALEQLGKHKEVMPQKSTYFFPKLATGMVMNSIK
jgi:uncharacterized protein (DUF1015 family)